MVNVRPTENVRQKIRDARKLIAEKKRRGAELRKIKSQLRNLMRKTLPQSLYTKKEALDLIQKIAEADTQSIDNIIEEVIQFAVAKNNQILKGKIENLLAKKTTKVESGRLKGTRVSVRIKEAMDFIKDSILPDDATAQQIDSKNAALLTEYNNLDKNPAKSEEDTMR
jgi:DNA-directed RNA polymerase subunit F